MFNVRLAGDYLYGKWLFTWLSLVMSLIMFYLCCLFPHKMSWIRSGTELSQFLRIFQPSLYCLLAVFFIKSRIKAINRPDTPEMTNGLVQHVTEANDGLNVSPASTGLPFLRSFATFSGNI